MNIALRPRIPTITKGILLIKFSNIFTNKMYKFDLDNRKCKVSNQNIRIQHTRDNYDHPVLPIRRGKGNTIFSCASAGSVIWPQFTPSSFFF